MGHRVIPAYRSSSSNVAASATAAASNAILVDLECAGLEEVKVEVPVLSYLVIHPQATLLLDAGFPRLGWFLRTATGTRQVEGQDIRTQLDALIGGAHNLDAVLLSHLHLDHVAGLMDLPKEVPVIVGPGALDGYEHYGLDPLRGIPALQELPAADLDLFGDGSLIVLHTPGHAPGNLSMLVRTTKGTTLLTFDASHLQLGYAGNCRPGKTSHPLRASESLTRLRPLDDHIPGLRVVAGHDAQDWNASTTRQPEL